MNTVHKTDLVKISPELFRAPLRVSRILRIRPKYSFPVCPRCLATLEFEYQAYCDRCGQCLDWKGYAKAVVVDRAELQSTG